MTTEPIEDPTLMVIRKYLSGIMEHLAIIAQNSHVTVDAKDGIDEIERMLNDWGDNPNAFQNMCQSINAMNVKLDKLDVYVQSIDWTLKAIHKALTDTTDSA